MTNLLAGTEVQARNMRWEVVSTTQLGQQTLYRLRCLEGELRGSEFDILYPFESVEPVIRDLRPDRAAPLRNWLVYHQAFLLEQALGSDVLLAVQPGRLCLEPYQLVPVLRAIKMSRVRLLLADGVGLGKTVQAGLIITELMARRVAHRILIVCPAGPLLEQWKLEMAERFGLRLDEVNRASLEEIRRSTELGANPFDHIPLGIGSIDFLKQEKIVDLLERASYDMVVLDEAHHCMDLGAIEDKEDSQRRRLAQALARRCDSLLLLTATPHDGNDRSFASLCELLDLSLVDGRGNLRGDRYRSHVVRRLKSHIPNRFKNRIVEPKPVIADAIEHPNYIALQQGLLELLAPELRRAFQKKRYSDVLAFLALLKRSVSTVAACKSTLTVVAERFQQLLTEGSETQESRRQRLRTLREYYRKLERFGAVSFEEEEEQSALEAEELAQQLADLQREVRSESYSLSRISDFVAALDNLVDLAEAAIIQDPKLQQLVQEVQEIRSRIPQENVLIYTEYTTSQRAALIELQKANIGEVLTLSGNDSDKVRLEITDRFRTENDLVLVSTDTAAEGLNLQQRCHHLIHLELPFNPNRLEQRNGRIDRYGQEFDPVVRYLFLRGTFEERILLRLIAKYERQRASLTFVPNTLGVTTSTDASTARLLQGLMAEDQKLFAEDTPLLVDFTTADENAGTDTATRELLEEIDRSLKGFQQAARTHTWLGDLGMNAQKRWLTEADAAKAKGDRTLAVDLISFVRDAVLLDGGDFRPTPHPEIFTVILPTNWSYGLDELPGYDANTRCLRLTTNLDITRDDQNRTVGFLGRAHPLVRRALDRVRNLSFGGADRHSQDTRASVVKADVPNPTLLFTFLGRVASRAGSEFEQVLAVKVISDGQTEFYDQADQWLFLADPKRAVKTTDIWQNYFQQGWETAKNQGQQIAENNWQSIAAKLIQERTYELETEKLRQTEWLQQRCQEITGLQEETGVQLSLLDTPDQNGQTLVPSAAPPAWMTETEPVKRLAVFAKDSNQPMKLRSEADGGLRIYHQRLAILESKLALSTPEIIPLGVLMLIPD
ncbi:helicase-related protein [Anabaena sp. PCC 7108]|uniref:helicase-related protein n=1 Tax=Anabaena sp. PCC 7108 TaxID=163908 RepID=UPI000348D218|nr:helicase-related protein [Anabaena sp. PCC 7108]